jgi:hypothetical protein
MTMIIAFQYSFHIISSASIALISIIILCLILTKRKNDQKSKQKSLGP